MPRKKEPRLTDAEKTCLTYVIESIKRGKVEEWETTKDAEDKAYYIRPLLAMFDSDMEKLNNILLKIKI